MSACDLSVVVEEKPNSMPPRTPTSFGSKKSDGSVAPLKPRQTLTACVSLESLMTHELMAWMVVAYLMLVRDSVWDSSSKGRVKVN